MATKESTAVARRQVTPPALNGATDPVALGKVLAASGYFTDARQAAQAAVKVMAGQELGFGPVASMTGVHIIEGKPSLSANLLAACVKRHDRYDYRVREHTDQSCAIEFFEKGESLGTSEFGAEDVRRAGLANRSNWKSYPKAMLFARALSQGVRWYCPDVTAGAPAYVPEELGAEVDEAGDVVSVPEAETPAPAAQSESAETIDDERVASTMKGIGAIGVGFNRLSVLFGSVGADAPKVNRGDSIAKALRALTPEQADELDVLLGEEGEATNE